MGDIRVDLVKEQDAGIQVDRNLPSPAPPSYPYPPPPPPPSYRRKRNSYSTEDSLRNRRSIAIGVTEESAKRGVTEESSRYKRSVVSTEDTNRNKRRPASTEDTYQN